MPKTTYMWDELRDNVAAEYENGVLAVGYTHEPGLYGNLLSQNRNGVTSYYHYDGRGDTVALTDDSGNVTDTKEYDAWGNVIASTGSTVTPYQFGGKQGYQRDSSSTLCQVRARCLSPSIARWISSDPLLFLDGLNLYSHVLNAPTRRIDPTGLTGWLTCPSVHDGEEFACDYGAIHVSPIKPGTDGVQVGLHLEKKLRGQCCQTCDSFRWIQVVATNWAQPFFLDSQTFVPRQIFVDNGNGTAGNDRSSEPWYGGYSDPGKAGRPTAGAFPAAEFDFQPSVASMWDYPKRRLGGLNGPDGSFIPKGDLNWQAVSCVVCLRNSPLPDIILGCVSWGFTRKRVRPGNQPGAFGNPQTLGPNCLSADTGPTGNTNSLMALFRNTLDNDEFVDYDYLDDYTFDAKGS